MKSNKKIYQNMTREELKQYQSTSNSFEKNKVEKKALQSHFDTDTLEGFADNPEAFQSLNRMDKKFKKRTLFSFTFIGVVGLLLVIITSIIIFSLNKTNKNQIEKAKVIEKTDYKTATHIESMQEITVEKQIKVSEIKAELKKHQPQSSLPEVEPNAIINEPVHIDKLPTEKIVDLETKPTPITNAKKAKEVVLSDLLLIDYRAYRSKPSITIETILLTGLPASEEKPSEESNTTWTKQNIPYIDYLSKSMGLFAKGKTKKALERFEVILKTYPNDLNALFYSGLCYYNLGQFNLAKQSFESCLNNEFLNFNEEANWYLMKSLKALGKEKEAKELYNKIKKEGGFYANYSY